MLDVAQEVPKFPEAAGVQRVEAKAWCFGDTGLVEPEERRVAVVTLGRDARLFHLVGRGAWDAGSVAALTQDADRVLTQQWGRYFYDAEATYGCVAGVRFENAHDGAIAFALFERAGSLQVLEDQELGAAELEAELAAIAQDLGLLVR